MYIIYLTNITGSFGLYSRLDRLYIDELHLPTIRDRCEISKLICRNDKFKSKSQQHVLHWQFLTSINQHNHFFDQFCAKLPGGIMSSKYCLCRCSVACLWISNIWLVAAELLFPLPLPPPLPLLELEEDLPPPADVVCCIAAIAIAW